MLGKAWTMWGRRVAWWAHSEEAGARRLGEPLRRSPPGERYRTPRQLPKLRPRRVVLRGMAWYRLRGADTSAELARLRHLRRPAAELKLALVASGLQQRRGAVP